MSVTHYAFADESNPNFGRFRSIAALTLPASSYGRLASGISKLMTESNVTEFKWTKTKSAKYRFAAIKIIDFLMPFFVSGEIRIDTLIWDIEDSRHKIKHRDDRKNFGRLYYQVLFHVLDQRWPDNTVWEIYPDQISLIDWQDFLDILSNNAPLNIIFGNNPKLTLSFKIQKIHQLDSKRNPLIQVADLFAGIGAYSKNHFRKKAIAEEKILPQKTLFPVDDSGFSSTDLERWKIIFHLNDLCKRNRMRVALKSTCGFETKDPNYCINFWLYRPQGDYDKAPMKNGSISGEDG